MKGYKTNFNLNEEENVLVETANFFDHKSFPFRIFGKIIIVAINIGIFVGAFFLITLTFHPSILTFAFLVMGSLLMIIGVLLLPLLLRAGYFSFFRKKRTVFYVTNQRIVELIRKGPFNRKNHFKEIKYKNLDYLIKNRRNLSFHKKLIFQFPYYALEDDVYKLEPKEQEKIEIHLEGTKGEIKWGEIKAFLFPMIPLIPHPRLKFIILNKNLVFPKDNL